jgi:astacin
MGESNFNETNERDESQTEEITGKIEYGIFSGPGIVNELVPFREVDGYAVTEGDIILGTVEELRNPDPNVLEKNEEARVREGDTAESRFGLVIAGSRYRWPNKTMPYEINPNLPNQSRVQQAMELITSKTGFRFVRRTNEADYVHFQWHQSSANSMLGKRGGKQIINLADWATVGTTVHEILHAMGVYHEQGRPDRDNYIRIHWANLADGWASQYAKPVGALPISTYDYCSIMHYNPAGGAKPGLKAFTVLRQTSCTVGQRQKLSERDIQTVKRIYP